MLWKDLYYVMVMTANNKHGPLDFIPLHSRRILLFTKAPIAGRVKSRLGDVVGQEMAAALHVAMIKDLLANLHQYLDIITVYLDHLEPLPLPFDERAQFSVRKQRGDNLGERMANAFDETFRQGIRSAIIIGSDLPYLTPSVLEGYFAKLLETAMVLGPTVDGGYYVIGFTRRSFNPSVFDNIEWSTNSVLGKTMNIAQDQGLSVFLGPRLRDIDTFDDLKMIMENASSYPPMKYLMEVYHTCERREPVSKP
jgi:rSAM/selenodomain-associated transferase 1